MKRWKKWGVRSAALWGLAVLFAGVLGWAGEPVYGASAGGQGTGIGGEQAPGRGWDASGANDEAQLEALAEHLGAMEWK